MVQYKERPVGYRSFLDVCLTEFVENFEQMLSDHLRVASLDVMTLYEVNQFTILKQRDRR